jgi:hypothetical protein
MITREDGFYGEVRLSSIVNLKDFLWKTNLKVSGVEPQIEATRNPKPFWATKTRPTFVYCERL